MSPTQRSPSSHTPLAGGVGSVHVGSDAGVTELPSSRCPVTNNSLTCNIVVLFVCKRGRLTWQQTNSNELFIICKCSMNRNENGYMFGGVPRGIETGACSPSSVGEGFLDGLEWKCQLALICIAIELHPITTV